MTEPYALLPRDPMQGPLIAYILFALGYFTGITLIAGVIYAYLARGKDMVADSHLTYLIGTFWISLAIAIAAVLLMVVGIGFLLLPCGMVWGLVRLISGFMLLQDKMPVSGTRTLGAVAF